MRDRKAEGKEREGMEKRGREGWRAGARERFQPLSLPASLSLVLLQCQLRSHCVKTSELHLLPCFSDSVESKKKTRRPWPWAVGTYKRPSVASCRPLCLQRPPLSVAWFLSCTVRSKPLLRNCESPAWPLQDSSVPVSHI